MRWGSGLRRRLFGSKPRADLDPVGYRLPSYLVEPDPSMPPLPIDPGAGASGLPPGPAVSMLLGPPQVRLMMTDGRVEDLPADPTLERRAAYLVRSMIPPAPPPPPPPPPPAR